MRSPKTAAKTIYDRARIFASMPVVIAIVALVLRLVTLDRESLWLDEVASLQYAVKSVENILFTRSDPHPPLYYLLLHYWVALGQNEFILRLPSTMAGAASVLLLYWLVREWGKWNASASAWLLAMSPLHVLYSQEARMYIVAGLFGLASTLFYWRGVRRASAGSWGAWIALTVSGLYSDYSMLLLVAAQIVLFGPLWRASGMRRRTCTLALLSLLACVLLYLPQAKRFVTQVMMQGGGILWYYIPVQALLARLGLQASASQLHTAIPLAGGAALITLCVAAWMLPDRARRIQPGAGWVWGAVGLYLFILMVTAVPRGLGVKRQTLILFPYVLGGIAATLSSRPNRSCLLVGLVLVALPFTGYVVLAREQQDWRSVARLVERNQVQSDVVVIHASYMQWPFDYYYRGQLPRVGVDPASVLAPSQVTALHDRVWLVLSNDSIIDPQGTVLAWFDSHMRLAQAWSYSGVRIRLYERGAK